MCKILNYHFYILSSIFALCITSCEKNPDSISTKYQGHTTNMTSYYKIERHGLNDSFAVHLTGPTCYERQNGEIKIRTFPDTFLNYEWEHADIYPADELYDLSAGDYRVTVSDDTNNYAILSITLYNQYIFIPSSFSPNGDGINDTWSIDGLIQYQNFSVSIYNTMGELLYHASEYHRSWEGRYKGQKLPADDYYYKIDLYGDGKEIIEGVVTLVY
ncbi:MAG: gliding motility-associated C-terminal domain-containing protein [Bacteroidota bacterium]